MRPTAGDRLKRFNIAKDRIDFSLGEYSVFAVGWHDGGWRFFARVPDGRTQLRAIGEARFDSREVRADSRLSDGDFIPGNLMTRNAIAFARIRE